MRPVYAPLCAAIALCGLNTPALSGVATASLAIGGGRSIVESAHLKPGDHCHRHGRGKLCHGANDYPLLYGLLDRDKRPGTHKHTRSCRHG